MSDWIRVDYLDGGGGGAIIAVTDEYCIWHQHTVSINSMVISQMVRFGCH